MRESELRKPFIKALKSVGALVIPYVGSSYGQQGTADVFVAHINWHGWIEFKGPTTKVGAVQQYFIDEMRKRKVNAFIVRLVDKRCFQIEGSPEYFTYTTGWDILTRLQNYDLRENR